MDVDQTDARDLVLRIVLSGGAIHPDVCAAGLVVVAAELPELAEDARLLRPKILDYFREHPTALELETSRKVLWLRAMDVVRDAWEKAGRPDIGGVPAIDRAWDAVDVAWTACRTGERLSDFTKRLRHLRSVLLEAVKASVTP